MKEIWYFWRDLVKLAELYVNCKIWLHIDCKEKVKGHVFLTYFLAVFLCKMFPMLIYQLLYVNVTKRKWIKRTLNKKNRCKWLIIVCSL